MRRLILFLLRLQRWRLERWIREPFDSALSSEIDRLITAEEALR